MPSWKKGAGREMYHLRLGLPLFFLLGIWSLKLEV
jgi:hypothetical protein